MKSIEVSAKTIEDAVSDGLRQLSCSISDCKVEILQEGAKGLFGFFGSKPATVRLTLTGEEGDDAVGIDLKASMDRPEKAARPAPERKAAEKKAAPKKAPEKNRMRIASNPQVIDRPNGNSSDVLERFKSAPFPGNGAAAGKEKPAKAPRAPKQRAPRVEQIVQTSAEAVAEEDAMPFAERVAVPAPENIVLHNPETLDGITQTFLLDITQRMGVDVQVDVHRNEDDSLYATLYGDTLGILIGRRGETLDALQYLTSLQVNRGREDYTRVTLDTENYRAKREDALKRLAARMASRAVKTGRKVSLEPMNPYERRILHASLQGNPDVTTHSEGDEPYRHVVVVPGK